MTSETVFTKMDAELRRGVIVLAVLSQLRTPRYGYSLRQALAAADMPVEEGTLYPLLRRLESQGVLDSSWDVDHGTPRRYYRLSADGQRVFEDLQRSWRRQTDVMRSLLT